MGSTSDLGASTPQNVVVGVGIEDMPPEILLIMIDKMEPKAARNFLKTSKKHRKAVMSYPNYKWYRYLYQDNIKDICTTSTDADHRKCRETSNLCSKVICSPEQLINKGNGVYNIPDGVVVVALAFEYDKDYDIQQIIIPDSVTKIMRRAFKDCMSLTTITIPDSVTAIGELTFFNCKNIASIVLSNSIKKIPPKMFFNCHSLRLLTIPNSVKRIEESAFENCKGLTSVTIPKSVTEIGVCAFYSCGSLAFVTIPDSVAIIREFAFEFCKSLTSITIPDSVTKIKRGAFLGCDGLTKINGINNKTVIERYAFGYCKNLRLTEDQKLFLWYEW